MVLPKVLLVSLGGTITMTSGTGSGITPSLTGEDLIGAVPALRGVAEIEAISPFRLPGASLSLSQLREVAQLLNDRLTGDITGALVVQGTDTIEETAFLLDLLVDSDKPVIVVGAMRGAEAPGADGPANLLAAVITAVSDAARNLGTLVVLNDTIHAARFVQKANTLLPSAFQSFGAGPLGFVVEGEARIRMRIARRPTISVEKLDTEAPVALVTAALGDDGRVLPELARLGYRGAVIEAMGVGHVPASIVSHLEELARQIPVVLSSRVASGAVCSRTYGFPGSEIDLLNRGLINGGQIAGLKARLLLSLLLSAGIASDALSETFSTYARD